MDKPQLPGELSREYRRMRGDYLNQQRIKEAQDKLDALTYAFMGIPNQTMPQSAKQQTIVEEIKARIEHHKTMIATLEWFASHLGLDDPAQDNLLVARVIRAGLEALSSTNRT